MSNLDISKWNRMQKWMIKTLVVLYVAFLFRIDVENTLAIAQFMPKT